MPPPVLIGRTIPPAGLAIDIGRCIDQLWLANIDDDWGIVVSFTAIPLSERDGYFVRKNGGLDIAGINIRYVFVQNLAYLQVPPRVPVRPDVHLIGVNMNPGSPAESLGGSRRAAITYPWSIQRTESLASNRRAQSLLPRRSIYSDWITNSMGGDAGRDSPLYYP